jgi:glutamyl-tRNA reductase
MSAEIVACGLNHKTAPLELREKLVFREDNLASALKALSFDASVEEAVILSTCHRTEIYASQLAPEKAMQWLSHFHRLPVERLAPHFYCYKNEETISHAIRVASGLDSMVFGEPQIFGQLKTAVNASKKAKMLGTTLGRIFDYVFSTTKQIRTETEIGAHPVSLGYAIMRLARNIFENISHCTVLFIGAGEMISLVGKYFQQQQLSQFIIANRTAINAEKTAFFLNAQSISLQEIPEALDKADIVISAIHSLTPLIGKGLVETAVKHRKHRPILMVDLAVPRNIETEIKSLQDIYLYHLDDLQTILSKNREKRKNAIDAAESIIQGETQKFYEGLSVLKASAEIQHYRARMHAVREKLIQYALRELSLGDKPEDVIEKMAYQLTNKLLHEPCLWIKNNQREIE